MCVPLFWSLIKRFCFEVAGLQVRIYNVDKLNGILFFAQFIFKPYEVVRVLTEHWNSVGKESNLNREQYLCLLLSKKKKTKGKIYKHLSDFHFRSVRGRRRLF